MIHERQIGMNGAIGHERRRGMNGTIGHERQRRIKGAEMGIILLQIKYLLTY